MEAFQRLSNEIMSSSGQQAKMTIEYRKDISSFLALVSSVRGVPYQHVLLNDMRMTNVQAFDRLGYSNNDVLMFSFEGLT